MPMAQPVQSPAYDVDAIRSQFPILQQDGLVFLDSAASAQKPQSVIDAHRAVYESYYANIHRGVYALSMQATEAFEAARQGIQHFIHAASDKEIIFTRGATEAINLVAQSYGRTFLKEGDTILLSETEHHSNIVPWQMLRDEKGLTLKVIPITDKGALDMDAFENLLTNDVAFVAITHISNALGTINPIKEIIAKAHAVGAKVLVDGCQAAPHIPVDVQALDADFYAFSAHKMYGPTGAGVLYGKEALLDAMPPWQGGGEMVDRVTFEKTTYQTLPHKFEAGTPAIAEIIAMGEAVRFMQSLDMDALHAHEQMLLAYGTEQLQAIDGLRLIGTAPQKSGILSFIIDGAHPHDIGAILDKQGVAIRTGHHCAYPVMERFGVPATARASIGCYTTKADIDALVNGLKKATMLLM